LRPPRTPLFPYTTLFRSGRRTRKERAEDKAAADARSQAEAAAADAKSLAQAAAAADAELVGKAWILQHRLRVAVGDAVPSEPPVDRKSTRLNSSHSQISY